MASDPSEFGDDAAGEELRGVSAMLSKGVEVGGGGFKRGLRVEQREKAVVG